MWEGGLKVVSSKKVTHLWRDHPDRASRNLDVYRDQKFYDLKLDFFLKTKGSEMTLWGAGPSGKKLAHKLISRKIKFNWVTENEKKIGKFIYGVRVTHPHGLKGNVILAVTQKNSREEILKFLHKNEIKNHFEF
jgi:hypothetical protein